MPIKQNKMEHVIVNHKYGFLKELG
ncbi:hypothetical protein H312_03086 [Anncaliia algerae PRA339]|uniref:Uncharacterized protein n=1 Tax=Anncaliia algerae PRA339 TaxID=1288291 RepID=A0A059EWY4_9MICR|nr:hypothetical protein H312_03086 [Anncaliia algerae PRA339]